MPRPAVIFGGPSPEHDISILSGLQSARALDAAGLDPLAIYWAKSGDFHLVPALLEARDYLTGVGPEGGPQERVAPPRGGLVGEGGGTQPRLDAVCLQPGEVCAGIDGRAMRLGWPHPARVAGA